MKTLRILLLTGVAISLSSCEKDRVIEYQPTSEVFVSSHTTGKLIVYNISELDEPREKIYPVEYSDAEGLYYDRETDILFQLDRTNNQLKGYTGFSTRVKGTPLTADLSSAVTGTIPLENGREIAMSGNKIVVAANAEGTTNLLNAFFVFILDGGSLQYSGVYLSTINLHGIHLEENTLYAVQKDTDTLAVFENIFSKPLGNTINPDMSVRIEGITQAQGLTYHKPSDMMILTDIGSKSVNDDGAIQIITDFKAKLSAAGNKGTIAASQQSRISGFNTNLGNPVDVVYEENLNIIYVAENAHTGGRVIGFAGSANGNAIPEFNQRLDAASALAVYSE